MKVFVWGANCQYPEMQETGHCRAGAVLESGKLISTRDSLGLSDGLHGY